MRTLGGAKSFAFRLHLNRMRAGRLKWHDVTSMFRPSAYAAHLHCLRTTIDYVIPSPSYPPPQLGPSYTLHLSCNTLHLRG